MEDTKGLPMNLIRCALAEAARLEHEQLAAKGANHSVLHEDVMVGSEDMNITGIMADGTEVQIFVDGEWVF